MTPSETTVLIVEDYEDLADGYEALLEDEYTVRTVYSGEEAIKAYDEDIDIVLLDRHLPDIPGPVVLDRLREAEGRCLVVMISGLKPDETIADLDLDAYRMKPLGYDGLSCIVDKATH